MDPALSAAAIKAKEGFIRGTIDTLIDGWIDQGEIEFIKAFAEPLPMMVIAELLGFPPMDLPQLKEWSYAWVLPFSRGLSLEQELGRSGSTSSCSTTSTTTIQEKRRNPKDNIITRLTQIEVEDPELGRTRPLTETETIGMIDHLLIGGNETTTFALSNGLWLLFRNPDAYARATPIAARSRASSRKCLRSSHRRRGCTGSRWRTPRLAACRSRRARSFRYATAPAITTWRGFPDPEQPDLARRNAGRHLAFGLGEHVCPGATLSRYEQNWAWEALFARLRNIRPVPGRDDYSHVPGMWVRALKSIHMRFDRAS